MEMMDHLMTDGRKTNENNKDSKIRQNTPKKKLKKDKPIFYSGFVLCRTERLRTANFGFLQ